MKNSELLFLIGSEENPSVEEDVIKQFLDLAQLTVMQQRSNDSHN